MQLSGYGKIGVGCGAQIMADYLIVNAVSEGLIDYAARLCAEREAGGMV